MRTLYVANFDFEHRLGGHPLKQLPEVVRRLNAELACVWTAAARAGDLVWTPEPVEPSFFNKLSQHGFPELHGVSRPGEVAGQVRVIPWGWTSGIRDWGERHGWLYTAPPQEVVDEVNARRFSFALEEEWGVGLPGAVSVGSLDELHETLRAWPHADSPWVLKADFGMSARERMLGRGHEPAESAVNWTRKRLESDGVVFLEPWVERLEEAGLQFAIDESGRVVLEGVTRLLTDETGHYRGSRFAPDETTADRWTEAVNVGRRAAERIAAEGYFGPLGIDAVRYRAADGSVRGRPLQDVNARHTMGGLSRGFRRLLRKGEAGTWLHVRWPDDGPEAPRRWFERIENTLPPSVRLIRTSPYRVGGRVTRFGTLVVIAGSTEALEEAEQMIFEPRGTDDSA